MKVCNPPNPEKKWAYVTDKMKPRKEEANRIAEARKQSLIDNGLKHADLESLIAVGYAMALEDNGLAQW